MHTAFRFYFVCLTFSWLLSCFWIDVCVSLRFNRKKKCCIYFGRFENRKFKRAHSQYLVALVLFQMILEMDEQSRNKWCLNLLEKPKSFSFRQFLPKLVSNSQVVFIAYKFRAVSRRCCRFITIGFALVFCWFRLFLNSLNACAIDAARMYTELFVRPGAEFSVNALKFKQ